MYIVKIRTTTACHVFAVGADDGASAIEKCLLSMGFHAKEDRALFIDDARADYDDTPAKLRVVDVRT